MIDQNRKGTRLFLLTFILLYFLQNPVFLLYGEQNCSVNFNKNIFVVFLFVFSTFLLVCFG